MGRGGYRPGAGRKPGPTRARAIGKQMQEKPDPKVTVYLPEELRVKVELGSTERGMTPLEFMLAIMRDPDQPLKNRATMAVAAAPFVHARAADQKQGKKEQQATAAANAGQGSEWGDDLEASKPN